MSTPKLQNLTVRQLQIYAAVCLWKYCNEREISHSSIQELFSHLFNISTVESLPDWEQSGLSLEIIGRGDPIPDYIMAVIPEDDRRPFSELVECCIEVGIVDMYGAITDQPASFTSRCLAILKEQNVSKPDIEPVLSLGGIGRGWGHAYQSDEVERVLREYGVTPSV